MNANQRLIDAGPVLRPANASPSAFRTSAEWADRSSRAQTELPFAPRPRIADVVGSPGQPLDDRARASMEARFGHDFKTVRVHVGEQAEASARSVGARAYAHGRHVVFDRDEYRPHSRDGRKLLAHELAHVAQQSSRGSRPGGEREADSAADRAERNQTVDPSELGSACVGVQRQESDKRKPPQEEIASPPVRLGWPDAYRLGQTPVFGSGPVLLPPPPYFPGGPIDPASTPALSPGALIPSPDPDPKSQAGAKAPSRLSLVDHGRFSFGLRLNFPEPELKPLPGAPPSALAETLARGRLIQETLTGQVPSSWEALDKGKLAQWAWGVFSTYLAPDVARSITQSLSSETAGGNSYELDVVLFTDFSGGGLSFTAHY